VLAHVVTHDDVSTVAVHNLGAEACSVPLQLEGMPVGTQLADQLVDGVTDVDEKGRAEIELEGYGYRWLRVVPPGARRLS
jgi:hypothetical protein